jgi:hypothetical protein
MNLSIQQIEKILRQYFPGEDWDSASPELMRLCLAERAFHASEMLRDNLQQQIIYTGIFCCSNCAVYYSDYDPSDMCAKCRNC